MTDITIKNVILNELNRAYKKSEQDFEYMLIELVHGKKIQKFIDENDIEAMDINNELNDATLDFFNKHHIDIDDNEDLYDEIIDTIYDKMLDYKDLCNGCRRTNYDWY